MELPLAFIVEDEEDLALVFGEAIRLAGYKIEIFGNGKDALARMEQVTPYLIVLDLHLPGLSGMEIMKHIRAEAHLKDVIIIIASADHLLSDQLSDQATIVLLKPISFSQLQGLAQRLLKKGTG